MTYLYYYDYITSWIRVVRNQTRCSTVNLGLYTWINRYGIVRFVRYLPPSRRSGRLANFSFFPTLAKYFHRLVCQFPKSLPFKFRRRIIWLLWWWKLEESSQIWSAEILSKLIRYINNYRQFLISFKCTSSSKQKPL